jgi:hypothetical protein
MKNIVIIGLYLLLLSTFIHAQSDSHFLGDVNDDKTIDIVDALLVARYYVGMETTLARLDNADVNADSRIDIVDALLIAQFYVGIIRSFPGSSTPEPATAPTPPPGGPPIPTREVRDNEDFTISYGETVILSAIDLIITVSNINDSRCPLDVVCVWEGEAAVTIDCWTTSEYLDTIEIKAPPAEPQFARVTDEGHSFYCRINCLAVDPYPASALHPTPEEAYTVTLRSVCLQFLNHVESERHIPPPSQ